MPTLQAKFRDLRESNWNTPERTFDEISLFIHGKISMLIDCLAPGCNGLRVNEILSRDVEAWANRMKLQDLPINWASSNPWKLSIWGGNSLLRRKAARWSVPANASCERALHDWCPTERLPVMKMYSRSRFSTQIRCSLPSSAIPSTCVERCVRHCYYGKLSLQPQIASVDLLWFRYVLTWRDRSPIWFPSAWPQYINMVYLWQLVQIYYRTWNRFSKIKNLSDSQDRLYASSGVALSCLVLLQRPTNGLLSADDDPGYWSILVAIFSFVVVGVITAFALIVRSWLSFWLS